MSVFWECHPLAGAGGSGGAAPLGLPECPTVLSQLLLRGAGRDLLQAQRGRALPPRTHHHSRRGECVPGAHRGSREEGAAHRQLRHADWRPEEVPVHASHPEGVSGAWPKQKPHPAGICLAWSRCHRYPGRPSCPRRCGWQHGFRHSRLTKCCCPLSSAGAWPPARVQPGHISVPAAISLSEVFLLGPLPCPAPWAQHSGAIASFPKIRSSR